jgi:hypothetical protein
VLDCRFSVQSMRVLKISLKCSDTLLIYISDELCNSLTQSTRQIETWLSEISNGLWWIKVTCVHSLFGLRCLSYFFKKYFHSHAPLEDSFSFSKKQNTLTSLRVKTWRPQRLESMQSCFSSFIIYIKRLI